MMNQGLSMFLHPARMPRACPLFVFVLASVAVMGQDQNTQPKLKTCQDRQ